MYNYVATYIASYIIFFTIYVRKSRIAACSNAGHHQYINMAIQLSEMLLGCFVLQQIVLWIYQERWTKKISTDSLQMYM